MFLKMNKEQKGSIQITLSVFIYQLQVVRRYRSSIIPVKKDVIRGHVRYSGYFITKK